MQTQYQLLYRYINETTNTAITNEFDYDKTQEFYTEDHKLYYDTSKLDDFEKKGAVLMYNYANSSDNSTNDDPENPEVPKDLEDPEKPEENTGNSSNDDKTTYVNRLLNEAEEEREQIILNEMANANKSNNFYIYTGTSKTYHDKYIQETLGYKVATTGLKAVPISQIPSSPDDYSKHFVMLGGKKLGVDGAYLVCKSQNASSYTISYSKDLSSNPTTGAEQFILTNDKIADTIPFEWYNPLDTSYKALYNENAANVTDLDSSRIITLSGTQYLITEKKEYILDDGSISKTDKTGTGTKTPKAKVTFQSGGTKEKSSDTPTTYSTIFYGVTNKKAVLPIEIYFATENGSSLANAGMYGTTYGSSSNTDGMDVKTAFDKYIADITTTKDYEGSGATSDSATKDLNKKLEQISQDDINNALEAAVGTHKTLTVYKGWKLNTLQTNGFNNYAKKFEITKDNLTKCPVPEHYEQDGTAPYLIRDNYKKIPLSPWILHSVHNSLESGINKAKQLVAMIGINNVKLIKTVPFDQFVKIK